MQSERRVNASLVLIGAASAGLYARLALRYPLALSLANPRASWVDLTSATWVSLACHTAIYFGLTVLYVLALRLLTPTPDSPRRSPATSGRTPLLIIVLAWLVCCGILLTAASSGESHDIFDYIFRGRMMTELGANPLTDIPTQYRGAPHFHYLAWHDFVDTYGPVWEITSAATAATARAALKAVGLWATPNLSCPQSPLACRSLIGYVTAYRLLAVGLTGVSAWLIFSLVRRSRPHLAAAALAAWLWNPLLLLSTAIGAHNDAAMIVLLLLMLWLLQRRRWFLALLALLLAAHVKFTVVIVTPVVGLWLVRRCGWRRAVGLCAAAAATCLLLSWLLYAPFGGWGSLQQMLTERAAYLANSPWRVLYLFLSIQQGWPVEMVRRLTVQLPTALFAAGAVLVSLWMLDFRLRRWQAAPSPDWRDDQLLWRTLAMVALLYLVVGSFWFQHWYLVWVLAPAVLLPDALLTRWLLPWLGFGALSTNLISAFAPALAPEPLSKVRAGCSDRCGDLDAHVNRQRVASRSFARAKTRAPSAMSMVAFSSSLQRCTHPLPPPDTEAGQHSIRKTRNGCLPLDHSLHPPRPILDRAICGSCDLRIVRCAPAGSARSPPDPRSSAPA